MTSAGSRFLNTVTKDIFLRSISRSRLGEGKSVVYYCFNVSRRRILSLNEDLVHKNGVVYLMSRDCRIDDNWAFLYSQKLALQNELPLFVCVLTKDFSSLYPTKRQLEFAMGGFRWLRGQCECKNVGFYFLNANVEDFIGVVLENDVSGVVIDFSPLRKPVEWRDYLIRNLPKDVPLIEVDAHNIVPAWLASDKQELMARSIRSKIQKKLPEYLTGFPEVSIHEYSGKLSTPLNLVDIDDVYEFYKPLQDVSEVDWAEPGSDSAVEVLLNFIKHRLYYYGIKSNDPSNEYTSDLSPWIHFGQISTQRVALEVTRLREVVKRQVDKFLEELIVRRELAENYCLYNPNYDNINGAADWAIKTLNDHRSDERPYVYTKEQFEKALTHDEMWNSAQIQLVQTGKMHGYMRMYWCKKILEWTETPEEAIEIALCLNDMYSLDGTDPNGFVGVMWSICCVHDQGWKERKIFGKIRYMVDYSLRKKFNMESYCARFGRKLPENNNSTKKGAKRKRK